MTKNLDRNNYASWEYKMHLYLLGRGCWSYIDGANEVALEHAHKDFLAWEHASSRVLYCIASYVHEQILTTSETQKRRSRVARI